MAVQLQRHLFTVKDFHRMAEARILTEDDRVELIDGEIVKMTPIGSRHAACVDRLAQLAFERVSGRAIVRIQSPIQMGEHSEPQPDLALLRPRPDFYAAAHPGPEDVLLIVEVAETSIEYDRDVKVRLYAQAGVAEVWVVDVTGECLHAYRRPTTAGYQEVQRLERGARVMSQTVSGLGLPVADILG